MALTADYHLAFIHPSERDQEPRLGQVVKGRVIVFQSWGLAYRSNPGYQAINDDAAHALLKHSQDHQLPLTDKSSPAEIKALLGISKGQFKRAVGHLLKARLVNQINGKLILLKEPSDD